jgi:RNA polymerase sigma factor (sigma-70 family)
VAGWGFGRSDTGRVPAVAGAAGKKPLAAGATGAALADSMQAMNDDAALIEAVLSRRPRAFEALVQRHQRLVWSVIHRMVGNAADTEELAQDTFLRVHRYLAEFRGDSALSTWIAQIAFSVAGRHLQKKRIPLVEPATEADEPDPLAFIASEEDVEARAVDADLGRHVAAAMEALPPIQRTLLTLFHIEELGIGEIARIVGMPDGTIKNYLFRARAAVRRALERAAGVPA